MWNVGSKKVHTNTYKSGVFRRKTLEDTSKEDTLEAESELEPEDIQRTVLMNWKYQIALAFILISMISMARNH